MPGKDMANAAFGVQASKTAALSLATKMYLMEIDSPGIYNVFCERLVDWIAGLIPNRWQFQVTVSFLGGGRR
jgi:hypothetical protein